MVNDSKDPVAHLSGDWTIATLSRRKIESLSGMLRRIETGGTGRLLVDCRNITATDRAGLELLRVWLQCARLRGFEPELVNLPDTLKRPLHSIRH